jgi:hypothetical protein
MASGPLTFKSRDVIRLITTLEKAGRTVARVEVDKSGTIVAVLVAERSSEKDTGQAAVGEDTYSDRIARLWGDKAAA